MAQMGRVEVLAKANKETMEIAEYD